MRENIWNWPVGIVSVTAFLLLFLEVKLYADATLQGFFIITGFIGWRNWAFGGKNRTELRITTLSASQKLLTGVGSIAAILVIGWLFDTYTDASIPYMDSLASGMSVVAQVLLLRKKLENWYLWIAVDVLSIGIYIYKEVYLTSILYFVFLILSILGVIDWKRSLRQQVPVNLSTGVA
jgi:nicotinamide mononucleotide transporter